MGKPFLSIIQRLAYRSFADSFLIDKNTQILLELEVSQKKFHSHSNSHNLLEETDVTSKILFCRVCRHKVEPVSTRGKEHRNNNYTKRKMILDCNFVAFSKLEKKFLKYYYFRVLTACTETPQDEKQTSSVYLISKDFYYDKMKEPAFSVISFEIGS